MHRFKSFATMYETFIEIVILYAHGALINQLNLLWWMWFKRYATMQLCICKHVHSIHTHRSKSFAIISETLIEMAILCTQGALINKLNLLWWCDLRGMQQCICKYVHSNHTHCLKSFAIISVTFNEITI